MLPRLGRTRAHVSMQTPCLLRCNRRQSWAVCLGPTLPAGAAASRAQESQGKVKITPNTMPQPGCPPYAGPDAVVQTLQHLVCHIGSSRQLTVGAADHEGAYRMLPVHDPMECFVLMPSNSAADKCWLPLFGASASLK